MEKAQRIREEMDDKVFLSRQSWHFSSLYLGCLKYFSSIWTLNWRVNDYVSRQGKGFSGRHVSTIIIIIV